MKKGFIKRNLCLVMILAMLLTIFSNTAYAQDAANRIYGSDKVKTSVKISKSGWTNKSDYVVIVNESDNGDTLCAAPLAKKFNAPILLTEKNKLSNEVVNELKRLNPKQVFIVGGFRVVGNKVISQLKGINIKNVERLWGNTIYDTALKVAGKFKKVDTVFVTSTSLYADSLSVSSIAAKKGAPILFSQKSSIKASIKSFINKNKTPKVYVIGGKTAISDSALKGIAKVERIYGKDIYETNKKIIEKFSKEFNFENVYFVKVNGSKGSGFPDGLAISALAAAKSAPLVLVDKGIDKGIEELLKSKITSKTNLIAVGGEKTISSNVLEKLSIGAAKPGEVVKSKEEVDKKDEGKDEGKDAAGGNVENQDGGKFTLIVSKNNSTLVNQELNIENGKNGMDYLKACASVSDKSGLITEINSIRSKSLSELSLAQRERGVIGEDWFIYLNGSKAGTGASGINPDAGDTLKFDFHEWDWHDIVDDEYSGGMPIKIEIPQSVKQGETFQIKATCVYQPVYNAVVKLDGKEVGKTDLDGYAAINIETPGDHSLSASKDGGSEEKTIIVIANGAGSGDGGDTESILKQIDGDISLTIKKLQGNRINIMVNSIVNNNSKVINITLYNDKNVLAYIGEAALLNGKCEFNTALDLGQYHGYYKENGLEKIEITNFQVK